MVNFIAVTFLICLFCQPSITSQEPELVFSFMIHRHGDRTPSKHHVNFSTNPEELTKLIEPYGYSQLTEPGMRRAYRLGQYIRSQYNTLIAKKFNESEIYLRSTDTSRTKMTMLVALATIFPPINKWQKDLNWTPVPYITLPEKDDFNRPLENCHVLKHTQKKMYLRKYPEMEEYGDVLDLVSDETGVNFNVKKQPLYINQMYNLFKVQLSLGLNLTTAIQKALPKIKEAADTAFNIIFQDNQGSLLPYTCGVLLNEFFHYANLVILNNVTEKMRIYSAHHENVYACSKISRTDISGMPDFATAFSLNLKREKDSNKFIVEPVFAKDVHDSGFSFKPLVVEGCGQPCYYEDFVQLTKKYAWDYDYWKSKCVRRRRLNRILPQAQPIRHQNVMNRGNSPPPSSPKYRMPPAFLG